MESPPKLKPISARKLVKFGQQPGSVVIPRTLDRVKQEPRAAKRMDLFKAKHSKKRSRSQCKSPKAGRNSIKSSRSRAFSPAKKSTCIARSRSVVSKNLLSPRGKSRVFQRKSEKARSRKTEVSLNANFISPEKTVTGAWKRSSTRKTKQSTQPLRGLKNAAQSMKCTKTSVSRGRKPSSTHSAKQSTQPLCSLKNAVQNMKRTKTLGKTTRPRSQMHQVSKPHSSPNQTSGAPKEVKRKRFQSKLQYTKPSLERHEKKARQRPHLQHVALKNPRKMKINSSKGVSSHSSQARKIKLQSLHASQRENRVSKKAKEFKTQRNQYPAPKTSFLPPTFSASVVSGKDDSANGESIKLRIKIHANCKTRKERNNSLQQSQRTIKIVDDARSHHASSERKKNQTADKQLGIIKEPNNSLQQSQRAIEIENDTRLHHASSDRTKNQTTDHQLDTIKERSISPQRPERTIEIFDDTALRGG